MALRGSVREVWTPDSAIMLIAEYMGISLSFKGLMHDKERWYLLSVESSNGKDGSPCERDG